MDLIVSYEKRLIESLNFVVENDEEFKKLSINDFLKLIELKNMFEKTCSNYTELKQKFIDQQNTVIDKLNAILKIKNTSSFSYLEKTKINLKENKSSIIDAINTSEEKTYTHDGLFNLITQLMLNNLFCFNIGDIKQITNDEFFDYVFRTLKKKSKKMTMIVTANLSMIK